MTYSEQLSQADRRECALYRFWVRHPVTGDRVLGYIGETARMPFQRLMEHIYSQPWADTIVCWEVDPATYVGKAAVLAAEEAAIRAEMPLYNYEFNLENPNRVEVWRAVKQRQAREPGWVPPPKGGRVPRQRRTSVPPRRRVSRSRLARWRDRRRWWAFGLAVLQLALLWLAFFAAALRGSWMLWGDVRPWPAAAAASAPFVAVWVAAGYVRVRAWWRRVTRPKPKRGRRG